MKLEVKALPQKSRIDKYLQENTDYSRSLIAKMIKNGDILVNNEKIKNSYLVKENDLIIVNEIKEDLDLQGTNIPIDIVYEDDYLMVINKQSGLTVHPGGGNNTDTLVNALIYYKKTLSDDDIRPGIVHRIDKDTSGLMLVAKDNKTHELLADMFKHKKVYREYIALVDGVITNNTGIIDAPIGRDETKRKQMMVKEKNSKKAITHFKVLKRYENNTLLSLVLETGRTHQIRVHMAYIGYPIHNDPVYNNKKSTEFGQFLHSSKIRFIHPITNEELEFTKEVPKYFQDYLNSID